MTGPAIDALDRDRTVVVVSCSPLEIHGPHLPTLADYLEADAISMRAMDLLSDQLPGIQFLHLPPLWVAADVLPHVGSIKFRSSTVLRVMKDLGRTLAKQGFKHIWVGSFHGAPRHFVPLETACHHVSKRYNVSMISMFSLLIGELTGGRLDLSSVLGHLEGLTPADLEGDAHAGVVETSMLLHLVGEHVDPTYKDLEENTVALEATRRGVPFYETDPDLPIGQALGMFELWLKFFEQYTYAGVPAIASADLGRQILDELALRASGALAEVYLGERKATDCHSPMWPMRFFLNSDWISWAFERWIGYRSQIW